MVKLRNSAQAYVLSPLSLQSQIFSHQIPSITAVARSPQELMLSKDLTCQGVQQTSPKSFDHLVGADRAKDGGTVTPSALAVFMLMTKSKRVGP